MSDNHVLTSVADGICTITFNRPERKNALNPAMYGRVVDALKAAAEDKAVRVVLVTGSGDAFTSGNDLGDFMNTPPAGTDSPVFQLLLTLVDYQKPVIAAVNGTAVGIGVTMLLHCDLVYAADTARFQMPFVNLGLVPEGGSSLVLPEIMGHARAAELLMLGERIPAQEADRVGLVTRLYPAAELQQRAREKALELASKPTESIRLSKELLKGPKREAVREALFREGALFLERLGSPAAMEAFTAFFEKRKPDFTQVGE
jgi:enoyl-CoA hydratase/carnithine racemase